MFINYAHRGASEYAPENTMASFCMGQEMGANGIETDVRATSDGQLVLFHDDTMRRITGLDKTIGDFTYAELLQMDFGSHKGEKYANERIVLLDDFLKYFSGKNLTIAIELKVAGIAQGVLDVIEKYSCKEKVIVTSFSIDYLRNTRRLDANIRLGLLTCSATTEIIDLLTAERIDQFCPKGGDLTSEIAAYARSKGLSIRCWGIRNTDDMLRVLEMDTDGMTVNFPDKLVEALR